MNNLDQPYFQHPGAALKHLDTRIDLDALDAPKENKKLINYARRY